MALPSDVRTRTSAGDGRSASKSTLDVISKQILLRKNPLPLFLRYQHGDPSKARARGDRKDCLIIKKKIYEKECEITKEYDGGESSSQELATSRFYIAGNAEHRSIRRIIIQPTRGLESYRKISNGFVKRDRTDLLRMNS